MGMNGSLVAYPHSPRVSADSDGGRYAEGRHLVEQFAANFCLGPLIGQSPGAKSPAGLGATHVAARSAAHHLSRRARMRSHSAALLPRPVSIPSSRRTWANFAGSAKRLSAIICRKAAIPISEPDSGQPAAAHPQGHIDRKRCERRPGLHSPPVVGFLKGLPGAGHRAHGSRFGGGIEHREARHHLIAGSAPGRGFYQA